MSIIDLIFPKTCLNCGKNGTYICLDCLAKVRLLKPVCPYCEKPSIDGVTHAKCKKKYGLDGLTSIWDYEGVVRKAILALKYKYSTEVGKELAAYFVQEFMTRFDLVNGFGTILVPVPLYWYRENFRGFNQSAEIGKTVAERFNLKFVPDLLIKKKATISQVELSGDKRRQNLKGVFAVNPNYSLMANNCSLVLFDDVFTTGATLKVAAKVLKRARVSKVWGLTLAR